MYLPYYKSEKMYDRGLRGGAFSIRLFYTASSVIFIKYPFNRIILELKTKNRAKLFHKKLFKDLFFQNKRNNVVSAKVLINYFVKRILARY